MLASGAFPLQQVVRFQAEPALGVLAHAHPLCWPPRRAPAPHSSGARCCCRCALELAGSPLRQRGWRCGGGIYRRRAARLAMHSTSSTAHWGAERMSGPDSSG